MKSRYGNKNPNYRHGLSCSPLYQTWADMKTRCSNPNSRLYKYYGGRGITVCERWASFTNFLEDMGERPKGTSLERVNNNGNYEPSNVVWADKLTQMSNTRHNNGHVGVSFNKKKGKWYAYLRRKHLGTYPTLNEALIAREEALRG